MYIVLRSSWYFVYFYVEYSFWRYRGSATLFVLFAIVCAHFIRAVVKTVDGSVFCGPSALRFCVSRRALNECVNKRVSQI